MFVIPVLVNLKNKFKNHLILLIFSEQIILKITEVSPKQCNSLNYIFT